ncbi:hypothetical protein [Tardiphaga sp. P5_C10]
MPTISSSRGFKRLLADPKIEIIIIAETLGLASDYGLNDRATYEVIFSNGFITAKCDGFTRALGATTGMDPVRQTRSGSAIGLSEGSSDSVLARVVAPRVRETSSRQPEAHAGL